MKFKLSVVDQLPVHAGSDGAGATQHATRLAKACDLLGYQRYWIAEHHNTPSYASPCPEILIAHIASVTERIRVGSGGVMLSHYSPYKVAEIFKMLATLYPGRIDLGIGRAPGGDELASTALAFPGKQGDTAPYEVQASLLAGFLTGEIPPAHPFSTLRLMPEGPELPQQWMLGSGGGSAALAGQLGMGFALALFIGTHERPVAIFEQHRQARREAGHSGPPSEMLAAAVICADSAEEARFLAASHTYWKVQAFRHGIREEIRSPQSALDARGKLSPTDQAYFDETLASMICDTPQNCRERLEQISRHYGVEEISVVNVTHDFDARIRSYELLAGACDLESIAQPEPLNNAA
jgi:luciferase family oxidoreductase group 1